MANPQLENGYVRIATETYEALCRIRINGEARQVMDLIIRKTYGFRKRDDNISLSQFSVGTGLRRPTVCRAINKLKQMNLIIITQKDNNKFTLFRFNKDFDTWEALPKKITLPKKIMGITQKDNNSLPKKRHTIDIDTKDNITKETSEQSSQIIPLKEKEIKIVAPFNAFEYIESLRLAKQRHISIIGKYMRYRKMEKSLPTKRAAETEMKRHLRSARELAEYSDNQLKRATLKAMKLTKEWTLETCLKVINKN